MVKGGWLILLPGISFVVFEESDVRLQMLAHTDCVTREISTLSVTELIYNREMTVVM